MRPNRQDPETTTAVRGLVPFTLRPPGPRSLSHGAPVALVLVSFLLLPRPTLYLSSRLQIRLFRRIEQRSGTPSHLRLSHSENR